MQTHVAMSVAGRSEGRSMPAVVVASGRRKRPLPLSSLVVVVLVLALLLLLLLALLAPGSALRMGGTKRSVAAAAHACTRASSTSTDRPSDGGGIGSHSAL